MTKQTRFDLICALGLTEIINLPAQHQLYGGHFLNVFPLSHCNIRINPIQNIVLYLRQCMQEANTPSKQFVTQPRHIVSNIEVLFVSVS